MGFEVEKQCSLGTCFFFANSSYLLWQCRICLCAVRAFFLLQLASFVINGIVLNLLRFWILFVIKKSYKSFVQCDHKFLVLLTLL
jgi:hypothetical protein